MSFENDAICFRKRENYEGVLLSVSDLCPGPGSFMTPENWATSRLHPRDPMVCESQAAPPK